MTAAVKSLAGIIISVSPRAERYTRWEVFSRDEGFAHVTVPAKMGLPFGLFDSVELMGSVKGKGFFANEIHLKIRPSGLIKNRAAFEEASRLARITGVGFGELPDYEPIFDLFEKALEYYSTTNAQPQRVTFKALYKMLAAEGFPVKEDWLEKLPTDLQKKAVSALKAEITSRDDFDSNLLEALMRWMIETLGVRL